MYSQSPLNELAPRFDAIVQPQTRKMHPIEHLLFNENFPVNNSSERFFPSTNNSNSNNNTSSLAQNPIFSSTAQQPTQSPFGTIGVVGSNSSNTFFPTSSSVGYSNYRSPSQTATISALGGNSFSPIHTSSPVSQQRTTQHNSSKNPIFGQSRLPLFQAQQSNEPSEELGMDYNEEFIYNMGGMEDIDNSPTVVQTINQGFPTPQQQQQAQYQRNNMGGNQFVNYSSPVQQHQHLYQAMTPNSNTSEPNYDTNLDQQFLYQQQMAAQKYLQEMSAKSMNIASKPQPIQQPQQQHLYYSQPAFAEGQGSYQQLRKEIVLGQLHTQDSLVDYTSPTIASALNNFETESFDQFSDPGEKSFSPLSTSPSSTALGSHSHSSSQLGEHPLGEHPSRTLFVRNISSSLEDDYLKNLFESYGEIRSIYTQTKHRGFVMISYFDIRHAKNAMKNLQHKIIRKRKIDIHYSIPKDNPNEKDMNQGTLVVFNLDPSITNEDLKKVFGKFGEIKEIRETPNKKHHKFIEFFDVRDADRAMKTLNKTELRGKKIKIEPSRPGGARRTLLQQQLQQQQQLLSSSMDDSHLLSYSNFSNGGDSQYSKEAFFENGLPPVFDDYPTTSSSLPNPLYTSFQQFGLYGGNNSNSHHHSNTTSNLGSTSTTPAFFSTNNSQVTSPTLTATSHTTTAPTSATVGQPSVIEELKKKKTNTTMSYSSSLPATLTDAIESFESESALIGSPKSFAQVLQNSIKADQSPVPQEVPKSSASPVTVVAAAAAAATNSTVSSPNTTKTKSRTTSNASGKNLPTNVSSSSSSDEKKKFVLDLEKVRQGQDKRTTLMIKNIPNKYTQKMILETIDLRFKGKYDFFYLPIDFKNKCNVGYAFINFVVPETIIPFVEEFNSKKWEKFNSEKVCDISYARLQGRVALINHFNNSSLMVEDETMRPVFN